MASTKNPMMPLYRRLSAVGLNQKFVKQVLLPDWWDDDMASSQAGYMEGLIYVSKNMGIDLASLADENAKLDLNLAEVCKYKKSAKTSHWEMEVAQALAARMASLAVLATLQPVSQIPTVGSSVRDEILANGHHCVNLGNLVDYCWTAGIPVLYLEELPRNAKRPDGLAARVDGRPAIILCRQTKSEAWMLFVLAHELGHIALGHVSTDGLLLDETVHQGEDPDAEESAANAFACGLITGDPEFRVRDDPWPQAIRLAELARLNGARMRIDPGCLILNFGYVTNNYRLANAALKCLEPESDAPKLIVDKMFGELDWSELSGSSNEFLSKVTGSAVDTRS